MVVVDYVDDMVLRNLLVLVQLGCCLDFDDFGIGYVLIILI